jgi:iron complex transport system permease protein
MTAPLSPRRLRRVLVVAALVLLAAVAVGVSVGPAGVGVPDAPTLALRAGRVLVALLVGAALSTTGAALQALLRNGLADPYVLGVSGGAALGAAAVTALSTSTATAAWLSWWGVPAGGVAGAAAASGLLLLFVARGGPTRSGERTVLVGVVLNAFSWAFVAVVRAVLPASATQTLSVWLIGAVAYPDAALLPVAAVATLVGTGVVVASAGALRLLRHGDDEAARLGVDVARVRAVVIAACSLLVGVAVATTGVIGFVGLLVPHALRRTVGADERVLLPAAAFGGAALLVLLDAAARGAFVVVGGELPVGALCALLGAPGFAWLLWRQGQRR